MGAGAHNPTLEDELAAGACGQDSEWEQSDRSKPHVETWALSEYKSARLSKVSCRLSIQTT